MTKIKVGVIFGSRSVEHEVSIITAHRVIDALDRDKYEVFPIYITPEGKWLSGDRLLSLDKCRGLSENHSDLKTVFISPNPSIGLTNKSIFGWLQKGQRIDVVFPLVHGTYGEDGTLQGLLELANIPYVGAGVLGSALGMDKVVMKAVFKECGLPVLDYLCVLRSEWERNGERIISNVEARLDYPVFVKPAGLGSSVGVTKARDREGLIKGLDTATYYDRRIIIERGLENYIEVNCSVLGNDNPIPSVCEQPLFKQEFLGYEEKYLSDGELQGLESLERRIPAPISSESTQRIQEMAVRAFKAIDCKGIARVDFFVDKKEQSVFINEINTIPGSLAFYLWEPMGIRFSELIDRLIELAFESHREKNKTRYSYTEGNLLKQIDRLAHKLGRKTSGQ